MWVGGWVGVWVGGWGVCVGGGEGELGGAIAPPRIRSSPAHQPTHPPTHAQRTFSACSGPASGALNLLLARMEVRRRVWSEACEWVGGGGEGR